MLTRAVSSTPSLRTSIAVALAVAFALTAVAPTAAATPAPVDAELAAKLQLKVDRWRVNHRAPGVAAAVRLPDGSRWIGVSGSGVPGKASRTITPDTPFAIASLTKSFIAATILQLRDEGVLQLSDPLSRWMPGYPKARKIKVRMLLNHRSGIFNYFEHPRYEQRVFKRPRHSWTTREILKLTGPRYCKPGSCFHYSNTNYVLLGEIIKRATGTTPARNIRQRFLIPLDLDDTWFQGLEPIGAFPAKGWWVRGNGHVGFHDGSRLRPNTSAATVAHAAGAIVSSVTDVSDWQDALLSGDLLSERSLRQMLEFHPRSGYGLAMRYARLDGILGIGHGGSLRGFVSIMYRLPEQDLDVVVLTNLGRTTVQGLADTLTAVTLRSLEPEEPETPEAF